MKSGLEVSMKFWKMGSGEDSERDLSERNDNEESFYYCIESGTGSRVGRKGISAGWKFCLWSS